MEKKLKEFISNIKYRLEIFQQAKGELDIYLASSFNVFNYIDPNENGLSDIIAELLDPNGSHGQGDMFLKGFLEIIDEHEGYSTKNVTLIREGTTNFISNLYRRIDITMDFDLGKSAIGIENKTGAEDQENQIKDYKEHLSKKYKGNYLLIYLSHDGSLPGSNSIDPKERKDLMEQGKLKVISYPEKLKGWLESSYKECKAEKIRWFLRDFIEYIDGNFKLEINEEGD